MKKVGLYISVAGIILSTSKWTGITILGFAKASEDLSTSIGIIAFIIGIALFFIGRYIDKL